jgi:hypothetical protein
MSRVGHSENLLIRKKAQVDFLSVDNKIKIILKYKKIVIP